MVGRHDWCPTFSGERLHRILLRDSDDSFMPRIPPADLNCSFYLYPSKEAAEAGDGLGGSGFWVGMVSEHIPEFWWLYAVSNQHVVHRHGASVIRANKKGGGIQIIDADPTEWTEHPDGHDIAIFPVSKHFTGMDVAIVRPGMFVTKHDVNIELVGVGDEVYMIGRFISHEGKTRNTPSARFGNISMLPGEPIYVDDMTPPQESFAVELRSMCGYSGSPVFVTGEVNRRYSKSVGKPDALLGVHWGHILDPLEVETHIIKRVAQSALAPDEEEVDRVFANTGMNGVVPAWRLMELLDMPKFKSVREADALKKLEQLKRATPGAKLDGATSAVVSRPSSTDVNPNGLEDFTRLVDAAARRRTQGGRT